MVSLIKGFDVSHHQDPAQVPWGELKRQGFEWCYIRAAYGCKPDRRFQEHVEQARRHGILWGPYLYLRDTWDDGNTPEEQIGWFAARIGAMSSTPPDLFPCLDVEEEEPSRQYLIEAGKGGEYLEAEIGKCVLYTSAVYRVVNKIPWTHGPLWVADYDGEIYGFGGTRPGWSNRTQPDAHQHTAKGLPEFSPLDLNVAHDLDAFRIQPAEPEPAPGDRVPELVNRLGCRLELLESLPVGSRGSTIGVVLDLAQSLADVVASEEPRRE